MDSVLPCEHLLGIFSGSQTEPYPFLANDFTDHKLAYLIRYWKTDCDE